MIDKLFAEAIFKSFKDRESCLYVNATLSEFLLSSRAVNVKHYLDRAMRGFADMSY